MNGTNPIPERAGSGSVTAFGVFPGYAEARRAVEALRRAGFRDDQIGVVGPEAPEAGEKPGSLAEEDALWSATEVAAGRVIVSVRAADPTEAAEILSDYGATARPPSGTAVYGNALPATPY